MGELIFNGESYVPVIYEKAKERDWVKPEEWPDIKQIVLEDDKIADNKIICLLYNFSDSFTFTLVNNEGLTAVKFNDGTLYEGAGTYTHTFDPVNDIGSDYLKFRWYILYFNGDISNRVLRPDMLLKDDILWIYFSGQVRIERYASSNYTSMCFSLMPYVQSIEVKNQGDIIFYSANTSYITILYGLDNLQKAKLGIEVFDINISGGSNSFIYGCQNLYDIDFAIIFSVNFPNGLFGGNKFRWMHKFLDLTINNSATDFVGALVSTYSCKIIPEPVILKTTNSTATCRGVFTSLEGYNTLIFQGSFARYEILSGDYYSTSLLNILDIDFTNTVSPYNGFLRPASSSLRNNYIKNITIVPNSLDIDMKFHMSGLTIASQWQIVNAFTDRTGQTTLVLTIPIQLYQKMTQDMFDALSAKNITISTY